MPTYIVLGKFDRQGLETLLPPLAEEGDGEQVDGEADVGPRRELVEWLAEKVDVELQNLWFTAGRYDIVMRIQADSSVSVLAFALSFGRVAGASTETLAAESDVDEVLGLARDAHTRHHTRHEDHG